MTPVLHRWKFHPYPFPVLVYLEWALLLSVGLSELFPTSLFSQPQLPWISLTVTLIFLAMGYAIPIQRGLVANLLYLGAELILILIAIQVSSLRLFFSLYLTVVIRSCFCWGIRGQVVIAALAFSLNAVTYWNKIQSVDLGTDLTLEERIPSLFFLIMFIFLVSLVFLILSIRSLQQEKYQKDQLSIAHHQLKLYSNQAQKLAVAQERNRISRDIHDSLGHTLTALNLQLEGALRLLERNPTQAQTFLETAKHLGSQALREVRDSVGSIRSDPFQGQTLFQGIQALIRQFEEATDLSIDLSIQPDLAQSDNSQIEPIWTLIYRIIQEALTNIQKYAQATQVFIQLETGFKTIRLRIQDNGKGFNPCQINSGFGLKGMQERLSEVDGQLQIISQPGQGCTIEATIPIPDQVALL